MGWRSNDSAVRLFLDDVFILMPHFSVCVAFANSAFSFKTLNICL